MCWARQYYYYVTLPLCILCLHEYGGKWIIHLICTFRNMFLYLNSLETRNPREDVYTVICSWSFLYATIEHFLGTTYVVMFQYVYISNHTWVCYPFQKCWLWGIIVFTWFSCFFSNCIILYSTLSWNSCFFHLVKKKLVHESTMPNVFHWNSYHE